MRDRPNLGKGILLSFVLCALLDFGRGYFKGHSIVGGLGWAVLGICGTACYVLVFGGWKKSD